MSEHYVVRPLSPMRRVIAARMTEAKRTIPHFRLSVEIEVDALLVRRTELRQARPGTALSLNDLLIKACAQALSASARSAILRCIVPLCRRAPMMRY